MTALSQLSPNLIWNFFEQICAIPHPSKHEQALSLWIQDWANAQGLKVKEDKVGNLIIRKPATQGMEDRKGAVLQAHLDMVPQKNTDKAHDFVSDPIEAYIDGDWVTANGTTLGSDNGIGMASCLAVLASDDIRHGPIEVLLTIDEEAGMTGAFGLEAGWLDGDILINTDSEQEGEIYMGCAGGVDTNINLPLIIEQAPANHITASLNISGLKGGHSGCDIHLGRGNANKLLARLIYELAQYHVRLVSIEGGSLRNAIPREANATILVPEQYKEKVHALVDSLSQFIATELKATEPSLLITLTRCEQATQTFAKESQAALIQALYACVNGVVRMSDEIPGVVETSSNLGVIKTQGDQVFVQCLIRSLNDSNRQDAQNMIKSTFSLAGAKVDFDGAYPGWAPDANSPIMKQVRENYQALFGKSPNIMVIHAGLECGLFKSAYPNWDMVSFGPTIKFPHSPDEKVEIESVEKYWQLMVKTLENIPEK